jgi:hypothetical protein
MIDWKEIQYERAFEGMCRQLQTRRAMDPDFTPEILEGILEAQRVLLGNNWDGRGECANIDIEAAIAACEHILAEWEAETEN